MASLMQRQMAARAAQYKRDAVRMQELARASATVAGAMLSSGILRETELAQEDAANYAAGAMTAMAMHRMALSEAGRV